MSNRSIGIWVLGADQNQRVHLIHFLDEFRKAHTGDSIKIVGSWFDLVQTRWALGNKGLEYQYLPGSFCWSLRDRLNLFWQNRELIFQNRNRKIARIPERFKFLLGIFGRADNLWVLPLRFALGIAIWLFMALVGILHSVWHYSFSISKVLACVLDGFNDSYVLEFSKSFLSKQPKRTWVIPELSMVFPWGVPERHVVFLDGEPWRPTPGPFDGPHVDLLKKAIPDIPSHLGLFVVRSPESRSWIRHYQGNSLIIDRLRWIPDDSLNAAKGFFKSLLEIIDELNGKPGSLEDWKAAANFGKKGTSQPFHVHLFFPIAFRGGVWEAMVTLIQGLRKVTGHKTHLRFSLSLPMGQTGKEQLAEFGKEYPIEHFSYRVFTRKQAEPLFQSVLNRGGEVPEGEQFAVLDSPQAMKADVWFALSDRFAAPILPVKPLGVIIYDVIQKYLPELFPKEFFEDLQPNMTSTIKVSDRILTTSDVTRADVIDLYGLSPRKVGLVPVACEPALRFEGVAPQKVQIPDGFILNITNPTPHKGLEVIMRAFSSLKKSKGNQIPPLVVCGSFTEKVIPVEGVLEPNPVYRRLQELVGELGLRLGIDFFVLGLVSEGQLVDLLQRCSIVVNAARYDNGTYSLIEGRYFGKKLVSTDYPAARSLYERFQVPVRFFQMLDFLDLAKNLGELLEEPSLTPLEISEARKSLADPKHGYARYAEQVYDCLLDLGNIAGGS